MVGIELFILSYAELYCFCLILTVVVVVLVSIFCYTVTGFLTIYKMMFQGKSVKLYILSASIKPFFGSLSHVRTMMPHFG